MPAVTQPGTSQSGHFHKEMLPSAGSFYQQELGKLSRPSRGWARGRCPWHKSKSGLSFSVNLETGGFYCHGCGVKGGDVLAFVMLRYNLDFKHAAKELNAWDEAGKLVKVRPGLLVNHLVMDFSIDGVDYHAAIEDEPKGDLQRLRRFYAEAADRLTEIHNGDAEKFEGEEEVQWGNLADSWELMRDGDW